MNLWETMLIRAIRTVPLYHFQSASHSRPFMENLQIDCCRHIEKDGHYMVDILVTPCIVPMMPGSASRVGGIGAAPDYGEVVSKSFLLAHEPDW